MLFVASLLQHPVLGAHSSLWPLSDLPQAPNPPPNTAPTLLPALVFRGRMLSVSNPPLPRLGRALPLSWVSCEQTQSR